MINEELDEEQIRRLWEYRNLIDVELYTRLNSFLIFESLLLSAASILYTSHISYITLVVVVLFGFSITLVWGYSQAAHKAVYEHVRSLCQKYIPEYELFRYNSWPHSHWPISGMWILTYIIPTLVACMWVIFLFL
jgi:hypothetical protein